MYTALARWCFRRRWVCIVAWLVLLVVVGGQARNLGDSYSLDLAIAGTESHAGNAILEDAFDGVGAGPGGMIVWRAEQGVNDASVRSAMVELLAAVESLEGVTLISPYGPGGEFRISASGAQAGRIAYADVSLPPDTDASEARQTGRDIDELIEEHGLRSMEGVEVEVGGLWFAEIEPPESEAIGLAFAIFVLIAVMGSVVAMGATVGVALVTVGIGGSGMILFSHVMTVPDFAFAVGLMIGLGVGIDYALFIVTRYREALDEGQEPEQALVIAIDSAGRSAVFAGATTVVSLLGMLFVGIPFVAGFGIVAAATVAVVMVGSVTLLPSVLALLGDRITTTRVRGMIAASLVSVALVGVGADIDPLLGALAVAVIVMVAGLFARDRNPLNRSLKPRQSKPVRETAWYRLSRVVQARPWTFAVGGTILLLMLAAPVLVLRLGFQDESTFPEETTTRKAFELLAEGFGPGAQGPMLVVAELSSPAQLSQMAGLSQALAATPGVSFTSPPIPNSLSAPTAAVIEVRPTTTPQEADTESLLKTLRSDVIPEAVAASDLDPRITGLVAVKVDVTDFLKGRTLVFFVVVLGASFVLLMAVFRSLVVPFKAVVMNMLSIGAAYGVVVAVFQWGWLGDIIGVSPGPIEPFIPMMLFAVLFGLSMDYEVFLLSRMKEEFELTGDPVNSVADGLAATARVITAAALIMVFVFGSFVLEDQRAVKMFGVGLAAAVLADASLVRMLIVPSTMELLGARNWWLPHWLDRILPNFNVEGGHTASTPPR